MVTVHKNEYCFKQYSSFILVGLASVLVFQSLLSTCNLLIRIYTERIKFSNFLKCLYCCCFEKYYNAADHIELV